MAALVTARLRPLIGDFFESRIRECGILCYCERKLMVISDLERVGQRQAVHFERHAALESNLGRRFLVALILSIPVLAFSPTVQGWLGVSLNSGVFGIFLSPLLAGVAVIYCGWPFYAGAVEEGRSKSYGLMTLASIAVGGGYLFSALNTALIFFGHLTEGARADFYWVIVTLVVVLLFGQWIETRGVAGATAVLKELQQLSRIESEELSVGDKVLIKPGKRIPADGLVIRGTSSVNEGAITGEFSPVFKEVGDSVIGGTINNDGELMVKVNRVGRDSVVSQIADMVEQVQSSRLPAQKLADKAASILTIAAIDGSLLTFYVWGLIGGQGFGFALLLAVTVLITACPHALGLAVPMVTSSATGVAARNGILFKELSALEAVRKVDYVFFGKTGTLTHGSFAVKEIHAFSGSRDEVLRIAASADADSPHPIARALVSEARKRGLKIDKAQDFRATPGQGISAAVGGRKVLIGSRDFMGKSDVPEFYGGKETLVWVAVDKKVIGVIGLSDQVRNYSKSAVESLRQHGVRAALLTGDNQSIAESVAGELGIDLVFANLLPEKKVLKIRELQQEGRRVAVVGDGVNDAPSLTQADVGIAIGAGADLAIRSADIILIRNDILDVVKVFRLSRRTASKIFQNLIWAAGYNIFAIPIAAGVLLPWGVSLRPEWGAILASASSLLVVVNALTLKRKKL